MLFRSGRIVREVELKGIPTKVVEERLKDEKCLKCGKQGHKWTECWCKVPVTHRVSSTKRSMDGVGGKSKQAKTAGATEAKVEPASAASGRIIEIPDSVDDDLDL